MEPMDFPLSIRIETPVELATLRAMTMSLSELYDEGVEVVAVEGALVLTVRL